MINDNTVDFVIIIRTDINQQEDLTNSGNDIKINKCKKNRW